MRVGVLPLVDGDLDAVLLVEPALETGRVAAPHDERAHERRSRAADRPRPEGRQSALRLVSEVLRRGEVERGVRLDRLRHSKTGSGIAGAPCQPCRSPKPAASW